MSIDGTAPAPAPSAPVTPKSNSFARIAGALFAPAKTFQEIAWRPDITVPLILLVLVSYLTLAVVAPRMDWDAVTAKQVEQVKKKNPNMSEADIQRMGKISKSVGSVMAWVSPLLMVLWYLLMAGVLLLAFRLMGGEGNFKQALSATLYAWLPMILLSIVTAIVVAMRGSFDPTTAATLVKSNPAFLVDMQEHPVLFSFLSSFDLFTVWTLVLLVFGFSSLSKLSRAKSAAIVVVMFLVVLVIKLGFAAMTAAMSGGAGA
jgi:hypothetical protein